MQPDKMLTAAELADHLRTSRRSLQRMRSAGTGPAFTRAGPRRVLYASRDIEAWEAAQRNAPIASAARAD